MSTSRYCKSHYFSIERLLVTEESVPCTFLQNKRCVGFLELPLKSNNILAGTLFQLPYWIAICFLPYVHVINIDLPKVYKKVYRDILKADARVVNLRKVSPFYYLFGKYLVKLKKHEALEIKLLLRETFKERFRMILDWAQNICGDHMMTKKLDRFEFFVFETSIFSQRRLNSWLKTGTGTIKATPMLIGYRKRKVTHDQVL